MDHRPTLGLVLLVLGLSLASGNDAQIYKREYSSITSIILNSNHGTSELLLEGDILVPKTRNAMKCYKNNGRCFWMKSADNFVYVPYVIGDEYSSDQVETIIMAMQSFHGKTCIRFIPRAQESAYLQIESRGGCFSSMGRVGEKQILSLAAYSCIQHGIIRHELLHALGFYHEHTRSDRDKYIRINWDYVADYASDNFQKQDTNNLNTPYDYSSVMHYDKTAFSTDLAKETITPIPDESVRIGQRKEMSDIDILRINKLYKCQ
uniref:Metalloendopeptidase n=1 Tax=Esox americanus TaxID=184450 RepID=D2YYG7_ESOAM|nr:hatching enzyme [Esox americanus]